MYDDHSTYWLSVYNPDTSFKLNVWSIHYKKQCSSYMKSDQYIYKK